MNCAHKTWVEISKRALTNNVKAFRTHIDPKVGIMAVVKSNAYGHGLVETAKIAVSAGASWLAVDNVDEGIALRKNGITKPILVLGYTLKERLADCVKHRLSFVAYTLETANELKRLKLKGTNVARVHLKIETGTTRQGISGDELRRLVRALQKINGVVIEGASTHFANIEDTTDATYAKQQLKRFEDAIRLLKSEGVEPPVLHTACSAAAILYPETLFNAVRVGIAMYGLWPSKETQAVAKRSKRALDLKPALTWKTIVAQVKEVSKGTPVSYGLTERVRRDSLLAVLPIGYWDGFDRGLSSVGEVLVRGHRCKVVGRVCMNMCVIDVTDVPGVRVEDEVVVLGKQGKEEVTASDIASKLGTINYEVVTRINPAIARHVIS